MVATGMHVAMKAMLVALMCAAVASALEVPNMKMTEADHVGFDAPLFQMPNGASRMTHGAELVRGTIEEIINERIINGDRVKPIQRAPYVVFVLRQLTDDGLSAFCTGTLVARDVVFTAAHCFDPQPVLAGKVTVCGGFYHLDKLGADGLAPYCRTAEAVKIPKQYDGQYWQGYDIAAVKLTSRLPSTAKVATVSFSEPFYKYPIARTGYIRGWGAINKTGSTLTRYLREAAVYIFRVTSSADAFLHFEGVDIYWKYFLGVFGFEGGHTCFGDSGGPLALQVLKQVNFRRHIVVGIASWGAADAKGRCIVGTMTFYSRLSHPSHAKFLQKVVYDWGRTLRIA